MDTINIALLCTLIGCSATLITIGRNKKKDTQEETKGITNLEGEIRYVSKGVDDIKYDVRGINKALSDVNERLIRVEESCKSAHKRIDGIDKGEM